MVRVNERRPPRVAGPVAAASRAGALRRAELAVVLVALVCVAAPDRAAFASSIGGDKTKIAALEQRIASEGGVVQNLVAHYDAVEGKLISIDEAIASDRRRLEADQSAEQVATVRLRDAAINAYVDSSGANTTSISTFINSSNAAALPDKNVYLSFASGNLNQALSDLESDRAATISTETRLRTEQSETQTTLTELASSKSAAQGAIDEEQQILSGVNSNLLKLVNQANQAKEAEEERQDEEEEALAAQAAQHVVTAAAPSPTPAAAATPGTYLNPLRAMRGISPERIDQGVDYGGYGPIYALGDGVVISTVDGGWPGGTYLSYRLTDGPAAGLVVYAAEDIEPEVQPGQSVTPNTVIGEVYEGYTGIETGWSTGGGDGVTMAASADQYYGGNSTAFGYNFSRLLESLGAPGGILQNDPPTGSVPAGWPSW